MKKKLIALLVAVALTIGAIPAYAFAAQEDEETIPPTETDATVETPAVDAEDSDILAWWETLTQEQKLDFVPNLPENDFEDWMYRLGELGLKDSHPAIDNLDNFEEFAAWWERLSKDKQNSIAGLRAEDENPQVWNDLISVLIGEDPVDLENNVERAAASRTRYVLPDYSYLHSAYLTNGTRGSPDTSWAQAYAAINSVADTEIVVITRGTNNWTGDMRADPWTGTGIMPLRRPDGSEEIAAIQSTSDIRKSGTITGEGNPTIYPTTAHITGHNNQDDWMRIQDGANVTISNLTLDGTEASKQAENKEMGCVIKVVNGTLTLRNVTIQNFTCWNFNYNRSSPIIVEGNGRLIMENCTIQNNHFRQRETDNMGSEELRSGAILMESAAQVTLTNTVIKNNGAAGKGSAIYQTTWSRLTLDGCVITGNTSHYQMLATSGTRITSAAVYMQSSSYLTLRNGAYIYNNKMNGLNSSHNVRLEDATRNTYGISVENRLGNINRGGYNGPSRVGVDIKASGNYNLWGNALGQWVVRSQGVVSALLEADSSIVSDSPGYRAESRNHNLYWVSSTKAIPTTYEYYVQGMANPNSTNDYTDLSAGTQAKPFRTVKAALESIQARIKDTNTTVTLQLLGDAPSSFDNSGWSDNSSGTGRNVAKIVIKKVDSLAAKPTIWAASGVEGTLFQNLQRNMEISNVTVSGDNTGTAVLYGKQNNSSANLTLTNTTITGFMPSTNSYFIASGTGGGTITLNGCTIENNQFRKALFTGNAPVAITNSTLRSNTVANGSFIDVPQGNKLTLTSTTMKSNVCQTTGASILWVANSGTLEINGGSQLTENGNNNKAMVEADAGSAVKLSGNVVIGSNLSPKNLWVKGDSILQLAGNVTGTVHVTCGNPATDPSAGAKFGVSNRYTATNSGGGAVFHPDTMAAHFVGEVVGNDLQWNGLVYEYHVSGTNTTNLTGTASSLVGTEQNPFGSLKAALQSIALRTNDVQDEVNIVVMHDAPYSTNSDTAGWDANSGFGGRTINRIIIKKADTVAPNSTITINVIDTTSRLFENVNAPLEIRDLIFDGNNKGASFYKNISTATSTNLTMQNVTIQNFAPAGNSIYFIDTKTNQANTGTVSLTNCVIKDNNFGFAFFHGNAQATMTNCTISGNSTQASGGASLINVEGTGAKLVLDNTTLNNNTSTDTANPFIWVEGSARLDLKNGTKIIDNNKTIERPTAAIQAENNASVYLSGDVTVSGNTGSAGNKNLWVKGDSILQLDNNVTGTVYVTFNTPTEGLKFGVSNNYTAINSDQTAVFYPDPAGTNLIGQVVGNDLQWKILRYVAEIVDKNGNSITDNNGQPYTFGSITEAVQQLANVREADGSQSCIIKLMDQSGQDDPTIKERYIDFGGNVSIVYLDLNGQTVMTQALVIPDNVTLVGMDTSGKLKNSATEGAPQGQLKVASGYTKGTMKDHKSGIIQLETSTAGDLTIDFAQNNTTNITNGTPTPKGIRVKMANSYPQYGGEYLPVMTSTASTLVGYPTLDGTGTIETPVSGFYETTYKFARFRLEPVKHHIVLDRTENKVVLGTYMMFQSNSQDLVDARWAIQETITAPNNAGSKSTYKNLPANEYGAAPSLGWRGPHFCYYVETTFEGNNIVKDALVTGNAYTLTNILKFRTLGYEDLTENQINTIFGALTSLSDMDNLNIKLNSLTIERKADTPYLGSYTGDYLAVNNAGECAFTPSSNWEADKVKLMEQLKDPTTQKNNLISYSHKLETISEKDLKAIVEAAYVKATAAQQQSMRSFLWTLGLVMDGNGVITPKS